MIMTTTINRHPFYVQGDDAQAAIAKIGADEPIRYPQEVWTPVKNDTTRQIIVHNAIN